jgi:hypothetical protein
MAKTRDDADKTAGDADGTSAGSKAQDVAPDSPTTGEPPEAAPPGEADPPAAPTEEVPADPPADDQPAEEPPAEGPPAEDPPVAVPPAPMDPFPKNAPAATVRVNDHWILLLVAISALLVLAGFGTVLFTSGLVTYPDLATASAERGYFEDSLVYRERRYGLALLLRTFTTGFSFVVGLALCTMGGLFILRQVSSLTTISGNLGINPMATEAEEGTTTARRLRETQFAFSSYSPGVVFMLGGVVIMAVTQWLAIPITALETLPKAAVSAFELNPATGVWDEISLRQQAEGAPVVEVPEQGTPLPEVPLE